MTSDIAFDPARLVPVEEEIPFDPARLVPVEEEIPFDPARLVPVAGEMLQTAAGSVEMPGGYATEELEYLDGVQHRGEVSEEYFGFNKVLKRIGEVVSIPHKAVAATVLDVGTTFEAGGRKRIADSIRTGLVDVEELRDRYHQGEELTEEEVSLLVRDVGEKNSPRILSFLFKSFDKNVEEVAAAKAVDDPQEATRLEAKAGRLDVAAETLRGNTADIINKHFARPTEEDATAVERVLYDVFGAGTTIGASIGVAVITKNPHASAVLFSQLQKNSVYLEARDAEVGVEKARRVSALAGTVEGALEYVGVSYFFKIAENSKGLWSKLGRMAEEGIQELLQTASEETITQTSGIREEDVEGAVQRALYSMFLGSIGAGAGIAVHDLAIKVNKEENLGLDAAGVSHLAQVFEDNAADLTDTLATDIENDAAANRADDGATTRAAKILKDFASGKPIDMTGLPEEAQARLNDLLTTEGAAIAAQSVKETKKAEAKIVEGRVRKLDQEISNIDGQVDQQEALRAERKEAGKLTKAIENRIDKLIEKRDTLDEERAELFTAEDTVVAATPEGEVITEKSVAVAEAKQKEIVLKGSALEKDRMKSAKDKLRSFQRGMRKGASLAKTDVKAAQKEIVSAIKNSGLPKDAQAGFLSAVTSITSANQKQAIARINSRISATLDKAQRKQLKGNIKKVLNKTKVKKVSGKPVSKFGDAKIQQTLDVLREASRMSTSDAEAKLAANLELGGDMTIDQTLENTMLWINMDTANVPLPLLADTLIGVQETIEQGKLSKKLKAAQRRERIEGVRGQFLEGIMRGQPVGEKSRAQGFSLKPEVVAEKFNTLLNRARAVESGINNGWFDTLDLMLGKTSDKLFNLKLKKGPLSAGQKVRDLLTDQVFQALQDEKGIYIELGGRVKTLLADTLNIQNSRKLQRKLRNDEKILKRGKFVRHGEETAKEWELSIAEGRKLWMELQDPTLRDRLREANGITAEMETVLEQDILSSEDIALAKAQMKLYKEIYAQVNEVYARTYGVMLPDNPFYSPVRSEYKERIGNTNEFLEELKTRQSSAPGFAKGRTATKQKIIPQSDIGAMMNHIAQSSHFIAMAETARDLNSVFASAEVRKSIKETFGETMLSNVDAYVMDFTSGHVARADAWSEALNVLNKNFTVSALGLKPSLYPKQMVSIFAFASDIPTKDYVSGVASFVSNPKKAIDVLSKSKLMQLRGASQDVDVIKNAQRAAKTLSKGKVATLQDAMLITTKLGDRGAIYLGGWSVYQHAKKQGKTDAEAMVAFEKAVASTQQSSDLDQLSRLQASRNPFYKAMTMFMTSPNAYWRAEKRAIRQAIRGELPVQAAGKRVFIYHFLLPMLFQYMADGFDYDEDNQTRAAVLGSLNGFMILGSILGDAAAAAQGVYYRRTDLNFLTGPSDLFLAGARSFREGEISLEDIMVSAGLLTGVPVKQAINIVQGVEDIEDDEVGKGVKRVLGWTEKTAGKGAKKKPTF